LNTPETPRYSFEDITASPAGAQTAARKLVPFEEACEQTDWSKYRDMPAFDEANRINAYNQYVRLEQETGE